MANKKYYRKITIDRDIYGSVNLPKEALDFFMKQGCGGYVEICWDDQSDILTLKPIGGS
jgi:hypothetical protein